ncbi:SAM-dependent methyltransferase [Pedobacter yulinensis]|uniref:SAM-dependent methyltransferase n=1 Tax=Pedobacter yulinensis TaxID=2126353 RepID=A0A2T3HHF1_9SPHI|nr:class I SAM-dependent methyltransferase [Pedobacter yulinensis]PST81869.1 SAM-dependent methyltransferase [Pedobacter yulinensis]
MIWDSNLYDSRHHFVTDYGADLLQWLQPVPGEQVLDLGCGTGQLTSKIAQTGARVTGLDASQEMITVATANYPDLVFKQADAARLSYFAQFDAIFSNATLHWIKDQDEVTESMFGALKRGGRLVAELGGKGNVQSFTDAIAQAADLLGLGRKLVRDFWFFPTIGEYTSLLEKHGFTVEQAWLFDRPTRLSGDDGLLAWLEQFPTQAFARMTAREKRDVQQQTVSLLRESHFVQGHWIADYKRLRIKAYKR